MKDIYSHYGLSFDVLSVKIFVVVIEFLVGKGNKLKKNQQVTLLGEKIHKS